MFGARVLTVAIALPLFTAALFFLPQWLWALALLPALFIGALEWAALAGWGAKGRMAYATLVAACAPAIHALGTPAEYSAYAVSCAFWIAVAPVWLARKWRLRNALVLGLTGAIVLIPLWLALVRLQSEPWVLLMFLAVIWIADTAAYFAGRQWGRHKLAPVVSPGKSWEGVAGAALALAAYYGVLWFIVAPGERVLTAWAGATVFAAMLALGIEGDLFESWMKRQAGVKDSGNLLPGHGGVLDRVDALTSTMPLAALAVYLS